jgi:glycosyltransferase involved in cell wall biosynthesis
MKVLHVLAELNHSGAERMLACSYRHWRAAGIEPVVVGMGEGEHPFALTLVEVGYEVVRLPQVRSTHGLAALSRTIRTTRPQIVHIHAESCFDAVALIAVMSPGVAGIVRTIHSNFRFTGLLRARRTLRVAFARQLGVVGVACSAEVAKTERSYYANRVQVVENWVDVDGIICGSTQKAGDRVRSELNIRPDAEVLALIGNCGGAKNHELIPAALRGLERPVHVLHVGHTHYQPEAETSAWLDVPARHTVHHLGGRDDVPSLLAASDLLVFPSLYEGMGLVPAEALCAGVPVLAADTVGLQWLTTIPSATLVDLEPRAWVTAIADALARDRTSVASIAATAHAQDRFGVERGVGEYVEAYEASLRTRPPLRRARLRRRQRSRVDA